MTNLNIYSKEQTDTLLSGKQDTLVSGTNIKTINSQSILGSGDISISGGSGATKHTYSTFGDMVTDILLNTSAIITYYNSTERRNRMVCITPNSGLTAITFVLFTPGLSTASLQIDKITLSEILNSSTQTTISATKYVINHDDTSTTDTVTVNINNFAVYY